MSTGRKPRRPVNFRATWEAVDRLDQRAVDEGLLTADGDPNRSELIRIMLAYAYQHMPKGWRP